jgi:hypothetical protein
MSGEYVMSNVGAASGPNAHNLMQSRLAAQYVVKTRSTQSSIRTAANPNNPNASSQKQPSEKQLPASWSARGKEKQLSWMLAPGTAENRPAPSQRSSNPNCTTEGAQKSADTLPLPPGKSKSGNGSYKTIDYPEIPKVRDHERVCC